MKFNLNKNVKIIEYKDKLVLANTINGQWVRITKEVFDIIKAILDEEYKLDEIANCFEDNKDFLFIRNLINDLFNMHIVVEANSNEKLNNKIISFEVTHRCNLKCIHCCIDADNNMNDESDLSTLEIKNILDKFIEWNPESIMISGGEPMLRKDFFEFMEYLRNNYKGHIILSTNGTLINKDNVHHLCELVDQLDISVDGVDEDTCSIVRGKGIFNLVIKNVRLIKDTGFSTINLSIATADKNADLEEKFKKLNEDLGTNPVFRIFEAVGRGRDHKDVFSDLDKNKVYIPKDYLKDDYDKIPEVCCCSAGKRELFVNYKGEIYPCPSYNKPECMMGNVRFIDSINNVISNNKKVEKTLYSLDPKNSSRCSRCAVNLFCWTCPGSIETIESKEAFEYQCNILKPLLMKRIWGE